MSNAKKFWADEYDLSIRAYNSLLSMQITSPEHLATFSARDIIKGWPNCGKLTVNEYRDLILKPKGLSFRDDSRGPNFYVKGDTLYYAGYRWIRESERA